MNNDASSNDTIMFEATGKERTGDPAPPPMGGFDKERVTAEVVEVEEDEGVHELQWKVRRDEDGAVKRVGTGTIGEDGSDVKADGVPDYIVDEYRSLRGLRDQETSSFVHVEDEGVGWGHGGIKPNLEIEAVEGEQAYRFEWELELEDGNLPTDKILESDDQTSMAGEGVINYEEGRIEGDHPEAVADEAIRKVEEATGSDVETSYQSDFEFPNWRDVRSFDESFEMGANYEVELEAYDEGLAVAWEGVNRSYGFSSSGEAAYDFVQGEWVAGDAPEMIKSATESIVDFYQSD